MANTSLYAAFERFWQRVCDRFDSKIAETNNTIKDTQGELTETQREFTKTQQELTEIQTELVNTQEDLDYKTYGYTDDDLYVYPEGTSRLESLAGNTTIKCVVIPKSVTFISSGTFTGCTNLEVVKILGHIVDINSDTFKGCTKLRTIEYLNKMPDGSPDTAENIYSNAFNSCGLVDIDVSNTSYFNGAIFGNSLNTVAVKVADLATWQNKTFGVASSNPLFYGRYLYENGKRVTNLDLCGKWAKSYIDSFAFVGGQFTNIKIPKCVKRIYSRAFDKNFLSYTVDLTDYGTTETFPFIESDAFVGVGNGNAPAKILVPYGRKQELMNMTNWSKWATNNVVEEVQIRASNADKADKASIVIDCSDSETPIYISTVCDASMVGGDFTGIAVVDTTENTISWDTPENISVGHANKADKATTLSAFTSAGGWTPYYNYGAFEGGPGIYLARIVGSEFMGSISGMVFIEIPEGDETNISTTFCQSVYGTNYTGGLGTMVQASIAWNDTDSFVEVVINRLTNGEFENVTDETIWIELKKLT